MRRGSVLRCDSLSPYTQHELRRAGGRAPCQKFMADLKAYRLGACGVRGVGQVYWGVRGWVCCQTLDACKSIWRYMSWASRPTHRGLGVC